jgi:hypothetical protein
LSLFRRVIEQFKPLDPDQWLSSEACYVTVMIRRQPWHARTMLGKWAHVLERTGLALMGASCGLFVAAHVARADIDLLGSGGAVLAVMLYGALGFYVGIDLPPVPRGRLMKLPLRPGIGSPTDVVELLSAGGTFLAAVVTVLSVFAIVSGEIAHSNTARLIILGWTAGATMQIAAGVIARMRSQTTS